MSAGLDAMVRYKAPIEGRDALWGEAIKVAGGVSRKRSSRGGGEETAEQRMRRLRETIDRELVAFHDRLTARVHTGEARATLPDSRLWDLSVPLTLFPQRDRGFTRLECIVEFSAQGGDGVRVLALYPEQRDDVIARAELGGHLDLKASTEAGAALPTVDGDTVAELVGELYGKMELPTIGGEARRTCVETEIIHGTGARWRLDDTRDSRQVGLEGHQLRVVLEVGQGVTAVDAAGYLQAYSETKWLSHALDGNFWKDFRGALGQFFKRGLPVEAYADWARLPVV